MTNSDSRIAVCARSPAKINLILDVLDRRSDRFHEIRSVAQGIDLCDELRFAGSGHADTGAVILTCDHPDVPLGRSNLIVQAAEALAARAEMHGVARIHLTKRIPPGAGLGGGSSNAATTLGTLNRLWRIGLPDQELARIGASVGSDVPLFFSMPTVRIGGRGERAQPLELTWSGSVLLIFAGCPVSTRDVYEAWSPRGGTGGFDERVHALARATCARDVMSLCSNDLEPAIFRVAPRVQALYEAVRCAGAPQVRISGAGQAAFVLFDDPAEARRLRDTLESRGIGTGAVVVQLLTTPPTGCEDDPWKSLKFV